VTTMFFRGRGGPPPRGIDILSPYGVSMAIR